MAIFHYEVKAISRKQGKTTLYRLAYITGQKTHDEQKDCTYTGQHADRVALTGMLLPEGASYDSYADLFNAAERAEKAANACTGRQVIAALPVRNNGDPLPLDEYQQIVEDFVKKNFTDNGYAAVYAIHKPEPTQDEKNWHVHMLITNRPMKNGQFIQAKERKVFTLDEHGNRIPVIDKQTGLQKVDKSRHKVWKRHKVLTEVPNPIGDKSFLLASRKSWADICNEHLPEEEHISELSNKARGIIYKPTIHEGGSAAKHEYNMQIKEENRQIMIELIKSLISLAHQKVEELLNGINERNNPTTAGNDRTATPANLDAATTAAISQLSGETKRRADERQRAEEQRAAEERRRLAEQRRQAEREKQRAEQQRTEHHSRGISL